MSTVINSEDFRLDYDNVIKQVAATALQAALAEFEKVVDENSGKLNFNIADICNSLTQAAQALRAKQAAAT